jgi:probable DNA metabolism protein
MKLFCYDGSWKGFLTLLDHIDMESAGWKRDSFDQLFVRHTNRQESLFSGENGKLVVTMERTAARVHRLLTDRLGSRGAWVISRVQAAEREDLDSLLVRLWASPDCLDREQKLLLRQWAGRVAFETHRYCGILRFFPLEEGIMYAPLRPAYRQLSFLAAWAADRFAETSFILHDVGRGLYRWYTGSAASAMGEGLYRDVKKVFPFLPQQDELLRIALAGDAVSECWKGYVKSASIPERQNSKLQQNYLPHKYREFLPESKP